MTTQSPLIKLENIKKSFFTETVETRAINDVSLSVNKGEYIALSGPSGCGKSTLLSILGLLDVWNGGHYFLAGKDVTSLNREQRAKIRNREIGFVFQSFNLVNDLSVRENVALPLTYRTDLSEKEQNQMVTEALEKVDMAHRADHFPDQLSGGQQQRVAVARAVAGKPSLILADEPTGNLDTKNADIVVDFLEQLHREGATICMVTHNPETAARAPRQVQLLDGSLVADLEQTRAEGVVKKLATTS